MNLFKYLRQRKHHDWIDGEPLVEPGISDVDFGRWARVQIRCQKCGEQRKVWFGVDRTTMTEGCPR